MRAVKGGWAGLEVQKCCHAVERETCMESMFASYAVLRATEWEQKGVREAGRIRWMVSIVPMSCSRGMHKGLARGRRREGCEV